MYQTCTSTPVNSGELRGLTVTQIPVALITRRSQVQILPPPLERRPGNRGFPGISHFRLQVRLPILSTGSRVSESLTCEFAMLHR
jgi:hypothetical protein